MLSLNVYINELLGNLLIASSQRISVSSGAFTALSTDAFGQSVAVIPDMDADQTKEVIYIYIYIYIYSDISRCFNTSHSF